jgi:hypothetical protein
VETESWFVLESQTLVCRRAAAVDLGGSAAVQQIAYLPLVDRAACAEVVP